MYEHVRVNGGVTASIAWATLGSQASLKQNTVRPTKI